MQRRQINSYAFPMGFDPLSLSPVLWLDASDATTLYDATSGGSLAGADGSVARWEDKSGLSNHAIQSTSGNRPVRKVASINGQDALEFGSTRRFSLTSSTTASANQSVFTVMQRTTSATTSLSLSNGGEVFAPFWFSDNNIYYQIDAGYWNAAGGTGTGYFLISGHRTASAASIRKNGVEIGARGSVGSSAFTVYNEIGRRSGDIHQGLMGEILLINSDLSIENIAAVESYLMTKWGI